MGFPQEAHCEEHDAGGNGLPCPWPACPRGPVADTDRISDHTGTYVRVSNITDDKKWYTWQRMTTRPR